MKANKDNIALKQELKVRYDSAVLTALPFTKNHNILLNNILNDELIAVQ